MTRAQYLWAIAGLAVVVAVLVIANAELHNIYQAEPDFVLGASLSLSAFFFTKAFSRKGVPAAVQLILEQRDESITAATDRVFEERLHRMGVQENIVLLTRSLAVTSKRINEFYDMQAMEPRFSITAPLLRVAMSDIDDALAAVGRLAEAVGTTEQMQVYDLPDNLKSQLHDALRDVREASARRNETFEALRSQFAAQPVDELWGALAVLTSDTLKAQRDLESLLSKTILSAPGDLIVVLIGYVQASLMRARTQVAADQAGVREQTLSVIVRRRPVVRSAATTASGDAVVAVGEGHWAARAFTCRRSGHRIRPPVRRAGCRAPRSARRARRRPPPASRPPGPAIRNLRGDARIGCQPPPAAGEITPL
ncbi:hypothetical protein [Nocardia sp. bgisy134]|uniref:hypothetical protein n=1 Tax=Nocardia sp. bgisy134 TaxID=3413789 RepID=UPI003D72FA54